MKTREVQAVTSNEEYVRMRIFDGDLPMSEVATELLRLEQAQHASTRRQLRDALERLNAR